jgi:hypothetical protein
VPLPFFYVQGGRGYKESKRVGYNMITIWIMSLLTYFTHISIHIAIYVWWNMLRSYRVFWKMGRVLVGPGHPSRCG